LNIKWLPLGGLDWARIGSEVGNMIVNSLCDYIKAGTANLSVLAFEVLVSHKSPSVRRRLAENPLTPASFLAKLATDKDPEVRLAVISNPATPFSSLVALSKDQSCDVRYGIAEDPNLPVWILYSLCFDDNPYVVRRAETTIKKLEYRNRPHTVMAA
jgi:hypothetical protein